MRGSLLEITCTAAITSYKSYQNSAPRACSYYQFHSRAGKMKIKNVNMWNYVTQTLAYLYEQEAKPIGHVQPVSSKLLQRGRTSGWRKNVYSQPSRLRALPLLQRECDGFVSCRTATRETKVIRTDKLDLAANEIRIFLLVVRFHYCYCPNGFCL